MNNVLLIPVSTGEYLALTQQQFIEAKALAAQIVGEPDTAPCPAPESLLTAKQLQERTGVPASWFLEQARKSAIPHTKLGKYVRFRYSEIAPYAERKKA
jgi:predicted DNA-binding transcriptional regulator AlpA